MGGKIVTLASSLPSHGPGALKNRDDPKALGTNKVSLSIPPGFVIL
jgi:protein transport protein SEC24